MFHCNGWGMPYAVTGMGGRHVVLRKVDGAEILRRVERARRDAACAARPRSSPRSSTPRSDVGRRDPRARGRTRIVVAGAPPPTRTIERVETELGWEFIQIYGLTETSPLLTMNRGRAEYDDARRRPSARPSSAARARPRSACSVRVDGERRGARARQRRARGLLGAARGDGRRRSPTAGSTPATAATSTTSTTSRSPTARRT